MSEYAVPMTLEFRVDVMVDAETAEEARQIAMKAGWWDNGLDRGEMFQWDVAGDPVRMRT